MVNFKALSAAIILSFSLSALANPVARGTFIAHPVVKKSGSSIAAIVSKDQARLARFNSKSAATTSATVTNEDGSYVASVVVGSQTVSSRHFFSILSLIFVRSSTSSLTLGHPTRGWVRELRSPRAGPASPLATACRFPTARANFLGQSTPILVRFFFK